MPWTFEITTGKCYDPSGAFVSKGYAGGDCGKHPEAINNADMTGIKNIGPLPEGFYTFGTPIEHSRLGAFAIPLIPDTSNDMKGRGDFYCHGDTTPGGFASDGCVIQPRATRDAMHISPDQRLQVVRTFNA